METDPLEYPAPAAVTIDAESTIEGLIYQDEPGFGFVASEGGLYYNEVLGKGFYGTAENANATISVVTEDGMTAWYADLKTALENAPAGSTVTVPAGEYDGNIVIDKAVTVVGPTEGEAVIKYQPVLDGTYVEGKYNPVIYATAPLSMSGNITIAGPVEASAGAGRHYIYRHPAGAERG